MNSLKKLLEILRKYESIIHASEYSQFTIDFIQDNESDIDDVEEQERFGKYAARIENDLIGAFQYQVSNILDIIKDGKDKDLFIELEKETKDL